MWLFSDEGFVSAVKHKYLPGHLMVRARYEKDIRALAERLEQVGSKVTCKETKDADYRWRLTCKKKAYKAAMCAMIDDLDYTNFKNKVHEEKDKDRDHAYMDVWSAMNRYQYDKLYPDRKKKIAGFGQRQFSFQSDNWNEKDWINWYQGEVASRGRVTYLLEDGSEMIWDYDQDGPPENWEDPDTGKPFDTSKWVVVENDTPIVRGTNIPLTDDEVNRELSRGKYHTPGGEQPDTWTDYLYGKNADFGPAPNKRGPTRGINAGGLLPVELQADTTEESGRLHELPPDDFDFSN